MTSEATARGGTLPRLPRWLIGALLKPANWIPATFWLFLVIFQAVTAYKEPSVSTLGLVLINSVALVLFMTRRDASRVGNVLEGAIAVSGTFVVSLLLIVSKDEGAALHDAPLLPTIIQFVGIVGWAISLVALGRSLGIAPADRGLVQHGPYRFVRHPIYAFEALFFAGWLINVHTVWHVLIIAVWCVLQITRIVREERILGGYDNYRQQVRWRIIPFVW
ncbi:MAG TPA: isoprenylcysteine carboxylmethyltransferase family protein [Dehalococcoidia bacterium]|jgi:protein-S-isoprenylcysteine O-methyltransferase Ste14|nr:isoprenylcysteine carboxylmethyltransferase family protein [Dehalococcoidia bacterium]